MAARRQLQSFLSPLPLLPSRRWIDYCGRQFTKRRPSTVWKRRNGVQNSGRRVQFDERRKSGGEERGKAIWEDSDGWEETGSGWKEVTGQTCHHVRRTDCGQCE
ncbi:hypothetical protein BLNAU_2967 [Blattamonas nauphoetae]|uniref:HNH endonuclease n=1 Tax=Blattamonas nauphoetae TaxID=2049346 RepID=A0ABQ9YE47_9EUKA|nr:hypothetical protein BLNAU_2967 [Blattamonas nauphoetae]